MTVKGREGRPPARSRASSAKLAVAIETPLVWRLLGEKEWSPEWGDALNHMLGFQRHGLGWRWTGNCDPSPLASAIAGGSPIPPTIRAYLATMLAPHSKWRGPLLKTVPAKKRHLYAAMRDIGQKLEIRKQYEAAKLEGIKVEAAVEEMRQKFKKTRSKIYEAIALSDKELLAEMEAVMGPLITGRD